MKSTSVRTVCGIRADFSRQMTAPDELVKNFREDALGALDFLHRTAAGDIVNVSEGRPALHTLLRADRSDLPQMKDVLEERSCMLTFASDVREGRRRGCRGHRITDVVNIGIGGSETGVKAVWHALRSTTPSVKLHFLGAPDGVLLERVLAELDPLSTLAVVSSKSFTTQETLINAGAVDQWFLNAGIAGPDRANHLVTVSANPRATRDMCLPDENGFQIWPWVGGRFSVWGSIGLPLAITLGISTFREFLQGAKEMDRHAVTAPPEDNLPLLLALYARFNRARCAIEMHCVLPYDERLRMFVPWLQQLEMESLGKKTDGFSGQALWGGCGSDGQHSFYQWLREGSASTSIDLLYAEMPSHKHAEHHCALISNARAQAEALTHRDAEPPRVNLLTEFAIDALTPRRLGSLMALYEHKTALLGSLCGINPFDQPGVEYGKRLCRELLSEKAHA